MISATMDPGSYQTEIQIYANETFFKSLEIKVIVYIPEIQVPTDHLSMILPVDSINDTTISIVNPMPVAAFIEFSSENGSSWLTTEPDTISIAANESVDLQIHINTNGLLKGNYTESANINAGIAGFYAINIELQVYDPSALNESQDKPKTVTTSPNPFQNSLVFEFPYYISDAELHITNSEGQLVYVKHLSGISASFEWDGRTNTGKSCTSGIYQYSIGQNGKILAVGSFVKL
jgi:hypothetical protein